MSKINTAVQAALLRVELEEQRYVAFSWATAGLVERSTSGEVLVPVQGMFAFAMGFEDLFDRKNFILGGLRYAQYGTQSRRYQRERDEITEEEYEAAVQEATTALVGEWSPGRVKLSWYTPTGDVYVLYVLDTIQGIHDKIAGRAG